MNKTTHPTSLETLFVEHAQNLVHFLRRKVGTLEDAEDIAQNAFIRIQRVAESGSMENPKAYLYQTASNLAVDLHRRDKLHDNYIQQKMQVDNPESGSMALYDSLSPERQIAAKAELQAVEGAIAKLSGQSKQAFLMHRIKGLSYAEIAEIMGVSVSSVEKYILQAVRQSRKVLEREGH